jgi:sulfatase maturation enzyme AslB (radical SAM superfamily)
MGLRTALGLKDPPLTLDALKLWGSHPRQLRHDGLPRPLYMTVETVNLCNNVCVFCAYRDHERPKTFMSMDVFEKAVRDYVEVGGGYLSLTPLVGDVFMDRYLLQRYEVLSHFPEITGSGFITNAAMAHRFDDAELSFILSRTTRLGISVYGIDADEYRQITGRDTYDHLCDGIRRLVELSRPDQIIWFYFRLLHQSGEDELRDWIRDTIGAQFYDANATRLKYHSAIHHYANWGRYNEINTPLPGDAKWIEFKPRARREQCMVPALSYLVFAEGTVSFCSCDNYNDASELRLGHIMESSLAELCRSEKARRLWNWWLYGTPKFCQGCSFHWSAKHVKDVTGERDVGDAVRSFAESSLA